MTSIKPQYSRSILIICLAAFFLVIFALLFSHNMTHEVLRDQNQFITSAKLTSDGLVPYRDYIYFHPPNLIFIYSLMFRLTNYLVLSARVFSTLFALATCGIIYYLIFKIFAHKKIISRLLIAGIAILTLITNPLFLETSGREWNHDLQVLLIVLSFLIFTRAIKQSKHQAILIFFTGLVSGIMVGVRINLAFLAFPIAIFLIPQLKGLIIKLKLLGYLSLGFGISMIHMFILYLIAPQRFVFGLSQYTHFSTLYWEMQGQTEAMTLISKLSFWIKEITLEPPTLIITILTLTLLILLASSIKKIKNFPWELATLAIIIILMFVSLLVPTPSWYWYFYAPIPLIILFMIYLMAYLDRYQWRWIAKISTAVLLIAVIWKIPAYQSIQNIFSPDTWVPIQIHQFAQKLTKDVSSGPILTFAPLFPLEGGSTVYPELATSVVVFRVAGYLLPDIRQNLKMIAPADFENWLKDSPPRMIITGFEDPKVEKPAIDYAIRHNYQPTELPDEITPFGVTVWKRL